MAWQDSSFDRFWQFRTGYAPQYGSFRTNELCFIRKEHKCDKMFEASKSCFIACPDDPELNPILELMSEKLAKVGIETIIAVKERAYGQDIFCTKICGKIIESKFCLVILDDAIENGKNIPNPNVYYEYGLMTSMKKHIIPLQKATLKLAFNIQSHDTVKYSATNIGSELDRAIKDAIKITEKKDIIERKGPIIDKTILRNLELAGFEIKDEKWILAKVIDDTDFKGFGQHKKGFYLYLGKVDKENELQNYLADLNVVLHRTEKVVQELEEKLKGYKEEKRSMEERIAALLVKTKEETASKVEPKKDIGDISSRYRYRTQEIGTQIKDIEVRLSLMSKIYIGFIVNSQIDATSFLQKAGSFIKKYPRFKLIYNIGDELKFNDTKISVSSITS